MKIDKSTTERIEWDIDLCKAEGMINIENGKIIATEVIIMKTIDDAPENDFRSNDIEFVRDVHKALGEYIQHVEGIMRGATIKDAPIVCHYKEDEREDCSADCDYSEEHF